LKNKLKGKGRKRPVPGHNTGKFMRAKQNTNLSLLLNPVHGRVGKGSFLRT